jgi:hypothetical protein
MVKRIKNSNKEHTKGSSGDIRPLSHQYPFINQLTSSFIGRGKAVFFCAKRPHKSSHLHHAAEQGVICKYL